MPAFQAIRTERLLLRPVRAGDEVALAERRNDPQVAKFQNWQLPFPADRAREIVESAGSMDGPTDGEWWMLTVADPDDEIVLGDLVAHSTWGARSVEVGYTFAPAAWGKGYAVEALSAFVDFLWSDAAVTRVHAMLHPDNIASAQVLERTGFLREGHTRNSFWLGEENSDDLVYGMTREEHVAWTTRPRRRPEHLGLVEITWESSRAVGQLRTHPSQERFVAPVLVSFGDALFAEPHEGKPVTPWLRAIHADGELVGFVMLDTAADSGGEPYLWRLVIDRLHQRRGIGTMVLDALADEVRSWGATSLLVSWQPGRGSPEPLYLGYGFEPTGEIEGTEIVARLALA